MGKMGKETVNGLIWGLFLIALGGMLLAANLGVDLPHRVWSYWPFLLIAMGLARMLFVGGSESVGDGFWILLGGLYGWISIWNVGALTWATAWPIFVIAGGLSVLMRPAFLRRGRGRSRTTEVDHVG